MTEAPLRLLFVGDVMLGRLVNNVLEDVPPEYPWGDTLALFARADLRFCNLECVLSSRMALLGLRPKAFRFRSDTKNVKVLQVARIDAVSLANNHSLDFGPDALVDTLDVLDAVGIARAGAGRDFGEASRPAMLHAGGRRIAFIAFTDNEPDWAARIAQPGVFYVPVQRGDVRSQALFEEVRRAKEKADVVIVSAHWGPNWGYSPPENHVPFARALVDAGADIIYGHSAHVFRGVELYRDRTIIYSAGDFIDDYAIDEIERNDESFIFVIEMDGKRTLRLRLYPTVIDRFHARLARLDEAEVITSKMRYLCGQLGTAAEWLPEEGYLLLDAGREKLIKAV